EDVSSGTYGNVSRANWKGSIMALKHSYNLTIKEIFNEDWNLASIYNECDSDILYQAEKLTLEVFDKEDDINVLIDKPIKLLIKTHDEGNNLMPINALLIIKNYNEAIKLFLSASEDYPITQVYLANYKSLDKAFYWYQRAANNGNLCGLFNLGRCNELGIGIEKNEKETFKIFKELAENGYDNAKFYLGYFYNQEVNKEIVFKLYNEDTNKKVSNMQNIESLYENADKMNDLDNVNYWYHKAAEHDNKCALYKLGCLEAQYEVGYFYDNGIEIDP
ncbi:8165_t:CDS:2, partial [Funneliformis geosporum]